jgi:hypothetical protein
VRRQGAEFLEIRKFGFQCFGGSVDKESGHSGVKILKSRVVTECWGEFQDFDTSCIGKRRR